ncbi:MAG: hypothetical protein V3S36_01725, partial [Acidiferrobacterales bacterium]
EFGTILDSAGWVRIAPSGTTQHGFHDEQPPTQTGRTSRRLARLLAMDDLARTATVIEIPPGILIAVSGAPFFLWFLAKTRRGW